MLTPEQVKERLGYIGASDAPGVLGLSRYTTPLEVWAMKAGQIAPKDLSEELPIILGHRFEEVVAELFTKKTGKKVRRVNETFYHKKHPFLAANIDRRVVGEDTLLEAKFISPWRAKEFVDDEVPPEYFIQVQQSLSVTGYKRGYLAVLIGNQDFIVKLVERDDALIDSMTPKLVHFWQTYVVPKLMPSMVTAEDNDILYSLFPAPKEGSEIVLGDDVDALVESRNALYADSLQIEALLEKAENEIKLRLGDNRTGKTPNNVITWNPQSRKTVDGKRLLAELPEVYAKYMNESRFRVLRIAAAKKEK
jgi:putative phage-type endonuclease